MATATNSPGKTVFVKEFLQNNPQAKSNAVNEAWTAAGMKGTISHTVVSEARKQLGLLGNQSGKTRKAAEAKAATEVSEAVSPPGKTSFVKEFLQKNPHGNVAAVNEAWAAAGMSGTIGATLVNKTRSEMGLTGNLRAKSKPKAVAQAKGASRMSKPVVNPGKTMFVKEFLNDHPQGNAAAVIDAWQAAGFDGTISTTLVNKMRSTLGLTGNLRGMPKTGANGRATYTGKKRGRPRKETTAAVNVQPRGHRSTVLNDLEADIDRLIFKAMVIGNLAEIEDSLRRARRLLYGAMTGG